MQSSRSDCGPGAHFSLRSAAPAADTVYGDYFRLLDRPDALWLASDAVQALGGRLEWRIAGEPSVPMSADTLALLQSRLAQLDSALAAESAAESRMTRDEAQYLSEDAGLGLKIDERQTAAAVTLAAALASPDTTRMWELVREARSPLGQLEVDLMRAEHPPFERWYHETWIRT